VPTLHPVQELAATAAAAFIVVFFIVSNRGAPINPSPTSLGYFLGSEIRA